MRIPAIRVNQWLTQWDQYDFSPKDRQRRPVRYFYVSSIPLTILRRLSYVPRRGQGPEFGRRQAVGPRKDDIGIQRGLEEDRANKIRLFVDGGHPWATLGQKERDSFSELKKPGWLPTSIVVNIVKSDTDRQGITPIARDLIQIEEAGPNMANLVLPDNVESPEWEPEGQIPPLEVIDGQHRLFAFEKNESVDGDFDLPVVLFEDLDISWQAYLFWTINISPKRISPSLAYDLYPLLRTEEWLQPTAGPLAYRETRAQELTEALWSNPKSPWYGRIGMLGRERGKVSQAAFVRSLTLSFIRRSDPGKNRPGGLFGAPLSKEQVQVLSWSRVQQAAYLIFLWSELERAIKESDASWAEHVREEEKAEQLNLIDDDTQDAAFASKFSLLATDQGVRGFLQVSNDLSFVLAESLGLTAWDRDRQQEATNTSEVAAAIQIFESDDRIAPFVRGLCASTAQFDWRSPATPGLSDVEVGLQSRYRAGSGYREVRRQLLLHLSRYSNSPIKEKADELFKALEFDK